MLTPKQQRFVDEYLVDCNATKAAVRAGYSAKGAGQSAFRMLKNAEIQAAITAGLQARQERTQIDADWAVDKLCTIIERCLQAEPVLDRDGSPTGDYTFQASPAVKAIETIAKINGFLVERHADVTALTDEERATRAAALFDRARARRADAAARGGQRATGAAGVR